MQQTFLGEGQRRCQCIIKAAVFHKKIISARYESIEESVVRKQEKTGKEYIFRVSNVDLM